MNGSFHEWLFVHSFIQSFTCGVSGSSVSVQVTGCPSEPALPHLRSSFSESMSTGDKWEAFTMFSIDGFPYQLWFGWWIFFKLQYKPQLFLWLRQWIHCQLQGFLGLSPYSCFCLLPKVSRGADKVCRLPLSGWKAASCLLRQSPGGALLQPTPCRCLCCHQPCSSHQKLENPQGGETAYQALAFLMLPTRPFLSSWLRCLL